jgi:coatomer subunit beta'
MCTEAMQCLTSAPLAQVIRRIDVPAKDIRWSDSGELVAIIAEASFYVLRFNRDAVEEASASGAEFDEDGIDEAFELQTETSETVRTGPTRIGLLC